MGNAGPARMGTRGADLEPSLTSLHSVSQPLLHPQACEHKYTIGVLGFSFAVVC